MDPRAEQFCRVSSPSCLRGKWTVVLGSPNSLGWFQAYSPTFGRVRLNVKHIVDLTDAKDLPAAVAS